MVEINDGPSQQRCEQMLDLVARQAGQPGCWWVAGAFGKGHHQKGKGEHGRVTYRYQERQRRTWCWSRLWRHLQ
jgi:hypothetical protein